MANLIRNFVTLFPTPDAVPGMFASVFETILNGGVRALASEDAQEATFDDICLRSRAEDGTIRDYLIDVDRETIPRFLCDGIYAPGYLCEDELPGFCGVPSTGPALSFMAVSKWQPMFRWTDAVMLRHFAEGLRLYAVAYDLSDVFDHEYIPTIRFYTVETSVGGTLRTVKFDGIPYLGTCYPMQEADDPKDDGPNDMFLKLLEADADETM